MSSSSPFGTRRSSRCFQLIECAAAWVSAGTNRVNSAACAASPAKHGNEGPRRARRKARFIVHGAQPQEPSAEPSAVKAVARSESEKNHRNRDDEEQAHQRRPWSEKTEGSRCQDREHIDRHRPDDGQRACDPAGGPDSGIRRHERPPSGTVVDGAGDGIAVGAVSG